MAARAGTAYIAVKGDFSKFDRELAGKTNASRLSKVGIRMGKTLAAGLAGGVAVSAVAIKKSIDNAVDLGEQVNKTSTVFRGSEKQILRWSKTTSGAIGVSRREALEATGVFGNMLVPMGIARKQAGGMSKEMVKLAGDLASFNNATPEDTLEAIRAGLAGESEPLRKFGVFLNDARLKQEALNLGLYKGKGQLDAAAKAQATYSLLLKDTKDAQGDFVRTSDGLANKQRILDARIENISGTLGRTFVPAMEDGAKVADKFLAHIEKIADSDDLSIGEKLTKSIDAAKVDLGPLATDLRGEVTKLQIGDQLGDVFDQAAPKIADSLAAAAPRAAGRFVSAFIDAGPWGRLLVGAFLLKKMGGLGAFRMVGAQGGAAMATGVAAGVGGAAGAGATAGVAAGLAAKLKPALKMAGKVTLAAAVLEGVAEGVKVSKEDFSFDQKFASVAHSASFGLLGRDVSKELQQNFDKIAGMIRRFGADPSNGLDWDELIDRQGLQSEQKAALHELVTFQRGVDTVTRDLSGRGIKIRIDDKEALSKARNLEGAFKRMEAGTSGSVQSLRTNVRLNMRAIARTMDKDSADGRQALAANFQAAVSNIRNSMDAGVISTGAGTREIERLMVQALRNFGFSKEQAVRYGNNRDPLTGKPISGGGTGAARGGLFQIGQPGAAGRDTIAARIGGQNVMVGSGEVAAVFNRHQLPEVNARLADVGGLHGFFKRPWRPHYMAKGGMVHVPGDPPGPFGDSVNRAVAALAALLVRRFKLNITAGFNPGRGHKSPGHNVTGTAIDIVPGPGGSWGLVGDAVQFATGRGMTVYYDGSRGSTALSNHGPGNHAHIELGTGQGPGAAAALAPKIARVVLGGPASPLRTLAQRAVDLTRAGAQASLDQMLGFDHGGLITGGPSGAGARRRMTARTAAISPNLAAALGKIRSSRVRGPVISSLLENIRKIGLPGALERDLGRLAKESNAFAEYGDRAGQLSIEGEDGSVALGMVGGKTQAQWLTEQLQALLQWRNAIIRAEQIVLAKREETSRLLEQARDHLGRVAGEIGAADREKASLGRVLEKARKNPKRNKQLIQALKGRISGIDNAQKRRGQLRNALKDRVIPALTEKRSSLVTARGDLLSSLDEVQGAGSTTDLLSVLPPVGVLGGQIFDVQMKLRELDPKPPKVTDPDSTEPAGDDAAAAVVSDTDRQRAELLEQLLREANLRTAVSQKQFGVLRHMPPFGGSFADGGVVPGPTGAPRTVIAHGGERITPPDAASAAPAVYVNIAPGMEWLRQFIRVEAEGVSRSQARAGARILPGRSGGGLKV